MTHSKPFRELTEVVDEVKQLGMKFPDDQTAIHFLHRTGYYRSGGYEYVFREMLPEDERDVKMRAFRKPTYVVGSSFADLIDLERFDNKLRDVCQVGLWDFELRVRAAMAHVLGRRHAFAHTHPSHLDSTECPAVTRSGDSKFDVWERTYKAAIKSAANEDFIAHLVLKYNHPLPIWATIDVLSFGSLPHLYELMRREDRIEVAKAFGVAQGRRFGPWLRSMVDFRNYCAHGSRLFNRHFKGDVSVVAGATDLDLLGHVVDGAFSPGDRPYRRLYINAALLAYMLFKHESGSGWHLTFRTQIRKIPRIQLQTSVLVDPARDMGFPNTWEDLNLWSNPTSA